MYNWNDYFKCRYCGSLQKYSDSFLKGDCITHTSSLNEHRKYTCCYNGEYSIGCRKGDHLATNEYNFIIIREEEFEELKKIRYSKKLLIKVWISKFRKEVNRRLGNYEKKLAEKYKYILFIRTKDIDIIDDVVKEYSKFLRITEKQSKEQKEKQY